MSAKIAMQVFESGLPPRLKATAAVLALFADADGGRIYPSAERLAWLVGKAERHVREDLSTLRALGVLAVIGPTRLDARTGTAVPVGGLHRTTRYRLDVRALPSREPWRPRTGGQPRQGVTPVNPDASVTVSTPTNPGVRVSAAADLETLTSATETLTLASANPDAGVIRSVSDPLVDPPGNTTAASPLPTYKRQTNHGAAVNAREPAANGNYPVIRRLAFEIIDETGLDDARESELIEAVKTACARKDIAYGPPFEEPDVVHRAVASACAVRKRFGRLTSHDGGA